MVAYILYDRKIASDYHDDGFNFNCKPKNCLNFGYPVIQMRTLTDITDKNTKIIGPFKIIL